MILLDQVCLQVIGILLPLEVKEIVKDHLYICDRRRRELIASKKPIPCESCKRKQRLVQQEYDLLIQVNKRTACSKKDNKKFFYDEGCGYLIEDIKNVRYKDAKRGIYDCRKCMTEFVCGLCANFIHDLDVDWDTQWNYEFWVFSREDYPDKPERRFPPPSRWSRNSPASACLMCTRDRCPSLERKKLTHSKFPYQMREDDGEYYTYEEFCEYYQDHLVSGVAKWAAAEPTSIFAHSEMREDDGNYYTYEQFCEYYPLNGAIKWRDAQVTLRLTKHL